MKKLILCICVVILSSTYVVSQSFDTTTIVFIRHAEKQDDGTRDPNLTKQGLERAQKIKSILTDEFGKIDAVYSTDFKRTQQTALPTAQHNKVIVNTYNHRIPNVFLKSLIKNHNGETILVVGHSNSTPGLVNIMIGNDRFENLDESVYDMIYIVKATEVGNGKVTLASSN